MGESIDMRESISVFHVRDRVWLVLLWVMLIIFLLPILYRELYL